MSEVGYKGRIIGTTFLAVIFLFIRTVVTFKFGAAPHRIPFPAIILIVIGWFLGREYDKSVYRANRDFLTGLFNRHYVLSKIQKIFSSSRRNKNKIAILLLDVNNFKQINDNFGHDTGDMVLRRIAELLTNNVTSDDIVSRWGGDEFLIISPFMEQKEVNQKIRRFENDLKYCNWEGLDLSVSVGLATYPTNGHHFENLLSIADANMYGLKPNAKQITTPKQSPNHI